MSTVTGTTGTEFRVVWHRERWRWNGSLNTPVHERVDGTDRHVRRFGTLAGAERFRLVLLGRGHEAYGVDPDAYWCCSGSECACRGETNREHYEKAAESKAITPLVGEPVIEARPYGKWSRVEQREAVSA